MQHIHYSIEARAYDILGLAAHDFWVLRDETGQAMGQLHGLATDRHDKILPIGRIGDTLKFYHFGPRAVLPGLRPANDLNFIKVKQKAVHIFEGAADEVAGRWDKAVNALPYLNSLDVPYTPWGILGLTHVNSNSAFNLLGQLMDLPVPLFSGYWQPGWRNAGEILTLSQLESLRYNPETSDVPLA